MIQTWTGDEAILVGCLALEPRASVWRAVPGPHWSAWKVAAGLGKSPRKVPEGVEKSLSH